MAAIKSKLPHLFAGLSLSIGLGLFTFGLTYMGLRASYLGPPLQPIPSYFDPEYRSYLNRQDELLRLCSFFAAGVGLVVMSGMSFWMIARSNRSAGDKAPLPEL